MKLAVTIDGAHESTECTYQVYDTETRKLCYVHPKINELIDENANGILPFKPFGIFQANDGLYLTSHSKTVRLNTDGSLDKIDIPTFQNAHQIAVSENCIAVANSANDTISIKDENGCRYYDTVEARFTDEPKIPFDTYSLDLTHVNAVWIDGDDIYYNLHQLATEQKSHKSIQAKFNRHTGETTRISKLGLCNHDIVPFEGNVYTLSSQTGEFYKIKSDGTHIVRQIARKSEFVRGLVVKDGFAYAGVTKNLAFGSDDFFSRIVKIDLKSMVVIDVIPLECYSVLSMTVLND